MTSTPIHPTPSTNLSSSLITTTNSSSANRRRGGRKAKLQQSEFLLPDGRKVLVALPEEIESLRRRYAASHDADPPTQVEVVVHGSDEHRHFLGVSREHHENRHREIRDRIGDEVVKELESVRGQLENVRRQLVKLEERGMEEMNSRVGILGENFEKWGFDAKVRTYHDHEDEKESGSGSGSDFEGGGAGWKSETASTVGGVGSDDGGGGRSRGDGDAMRLFRRPVVKQYFHRGLLWRAAEETQVMSFELFFDLLYVGIIAINGDHAAENATGLELLRFVVTFGMSWKIWSDVQQLVSWFETNDILQRVEILFLIACLLGHTTNMLQTFSATQDSFTQLVTFYLAARLFMAAYCALTAFLLPLVKGMMISQILNILVGAALWIASTALPPIAASADEHHPERRAEEAASSTATAHAEALAPQRPGRIALIFVALFVDIWGSMVPVFLFRFARSHTSPMAKRIGRFFEFYPAINIEHKVERTNAFVTLVLGYSVVAMIYQNTGAFVLNAFLGKAFLGLTQAFIFNWLYFEVDGSNIRTHAIRRRVDSASLWQNAHLIFIMSYILSAASMIKIVVIRDCPNAPLEALTPFYQHRSDVVVSLGLRLYYCVGLGLALFSMGLISLSHEHRVPAGTCKLPKSVRLANRFAVCLVFFCLPAAGDRLNSLEMVALTTCLSAWTLLFELWGKTCKTQPFFVGNADGVSAVDAKCRYTARCTRKQLEEATKSDGEIDIVELGRREKTAAALTTS